jgi:ABC-type nickel/cobalt efflux system permease component RcnA
LSWRLVVAPGLYLCAAVLAKRSASVLGQVSAGVVFVLAGLWCVGVLRSSFGRLRKEEEEVRSQ